MINHNLFIVIDFVHHTATSAAAVIRRVEQMISVEEHVSLLVSTRSGIVRPNLV